MTTQHASASSNLPLDMIIFGGTGDLSFRKLLPALYMAHLHCNLPPDTRILTIGRKPWSREEYIHEFMEAKAKPFIDHILTFSILDSKIWFRNFQVGSFRFEFGVPFSCFHPLVQILEKDLLQPNGPPQMSLVEIGPRFVLTPIRIFEGAFGGATVYSNPGT